MPIFSVIIPVFNNAKYVSKAIESVLCQTLHDFEILVIDDGSTDNSFEIISQIAFKSKEVKLFKQNHKERAAARNLGISNSSGEYIAFLDSDDSWFPQKLEYDLDVFKKCPEASVVYSDAQVVTEVGRNAGIRHSGCYKRLKDKILCNNFLITSSVSIKKSCFNEVGFFNEDVNLSGSEDWEMWVRLSQRFNFVHNNKVLVKYRQHESTSIIADSIERSMLTAAKLMFSEFNEKASERIIKASYANTYCTIALNYSIAGNRTKALDYLKKSFIFAKGSIFDYKFIYSLANLLMRKRSLLLSPGDGIVMPIPNFDGSGGLQNQAKLLIQELERNGLRVFVLTRNYFNLSSQEKKNNLFIRRYSYLKSHKILSSLYYLVASLFWLIFNNDKYKIVQCFQLTSSLNIGVLNKLFTGKPVVARLSSTGEKGDVCEMANLTLGNIRKHLLKHVDRFVVLNDEMKNDLSSVSVLSAKKTNFIPNGVFLQERSAFDNETREYYKKSLGLPYRYIVTYVGRLTKGKGLMDLILSWEKIISIHPGAHLILLGNGGLYNNIENELKDLTKSLGLEDSVYFYGEVSNVSDYLLASDVFVLPSLSEGMSNALLEAMSCGNIIVSTKIPAHDSLLNPNNSLLIPPGDKEELFNSLNRVLNNPSEYYGLGKEAKKKVGFYSMKHIADRYIKMYQELA
ncbi:MAG: glycosyltransferase [Candidatus Omnitrophica bacterium]|nr:glycosyltransferase [Candidatus Omnitrophota bacterium]